MEKIPWTGSGFADVRQIPAEDTESVASSSFVQFVKTIRDSEQLVWTSILRRAREGYTRLKFFVFRVFRVFRGKPRSHFGTQYAYYFPLFTGSDEAWACVSTDGVPDLTQGSRWRGVSVRNAHGRSVKSWPCP